MATARKQAYLEVGHAGPELHIDQRVLFAQNSVVDKAIQIVAPTSFWEHNLYPAHLHPFAKQPRQRQVQYTKSHILLAAAGWQRISHTCQMCELRTKRKSIPLPAAITALCSIRATILHLDGHSRTIAKKKWMRLMRRHPDEPLLQTDKGCSYVQDFIYTHGEHPFHSLDRHDLRLHVFFE